jgi:hypothetical protein
MFSACPALSGDWLYETPVGGWQLSAKRLAAAWIFSQFED